MYIAIVLLLVIIIVSLMVYNISIHRKIETFENLNQKITSLNVLQDLMDTVGECTTAKEKFEKINNILIEKYNIKYSTIVIFNGVEYIIKASNVAEKHWDTLKNLQLTEVFKDSAKTAIPKYITVDKEGERLPYQKPEFERAKSAIFFPLYIDNVYIGYWIIEGDKPHEFDNTDVTILEVVKNNIVSVLKTITNQQIIENTVRQDLFSGLLSAEYLYGEGKRIIEKYTISSICLFRITNLEEINIKYSRRTGDKVITEVAKSVQPLLSNEYVFVRYMGPKFAIAFSGVELEAVGDIIKKIKEKVEDLEIEPAEDYYGENEEETVKPVINAAVTLYYKGTGLEEVAKKLEQYLDSSKNESNINFL